MGMVGAIDKGEVTSLSSTKEINALIVDGDVGPQMI